MKRIVLLLLIVLQTPLSAITLPNLGIDPTKWYEGFLVIEAIQEIQTIAEEQVFQMGQEMKQEFEVVFNQKDNQIAVLQGQVKTLRGVAIATSVVTVLTFVGIAVFR